jgi:uncharacterized protein (DUF1697 family)
MDQDWIALLRAINVGGRNRVPMAALRDVFEAAGCRSVSTYIQSGNVLFTRPAPDRAALAAELEAAVEAEFAVRGSIVLRTFEELRAVAGSHPFDNDTARTSVTFLAAEPEPDRVRELMDVDIAPDEVAVVGSDVYLRYPNGIRDARLTGALLERRLGMAGTSRNWRTVTKLAELTR